MVIRRIALGLVTFALGGACANVWGFKDVTASIDGGADASSNGTSGSAGDTGTGSSSGTTSGSSADALPDVVPVLDGAPDTSNAPDVDAPPDAPLEATEQHCASGPYVCRQVICTLATQFCKASSSDSTLGTCADFPPECVPCAGNSNLCACLALYDPNYASYTSCEATSDESVLVWVN